MPTGWIRAYENELAQFGFADSDFRERDARAAFREGFSTALTDAPNGNAGVLATLAWGDVVELPDGIGDGEWTAAAAGGIAGFIRTAHLVEVAYVRRRGVSNFKTQITYQRNTPGGGTEAVRVELLWGDCVQILRRDGDTCHARARAIFGAVPASDLTSEPLLEVYFIDVGQGDGVLVRTPDARHLLVDGGLERAKQQTGKNAADFVDWKFYVDYGHYEIALDSITASHSDNDHYGGLHDLVKTAPEDERELDCRRVRIGSFHHPGLSRWENRAHADPPHRDGLGPRLTSASGQDLFVRLLGDRDDAEQAIVNGAENELSGPWKWFIRDVLANSAATTVERVGVTGGQLAQGALPVLWDDTGTYRIVVLGPVTVEHAGAPALPDLGVRSINTNGHSVCYRLDYGNARILLTGDLNKASMDWLAGEYGDLMAAWRCDVVKACHHGSHDISYRFLQAMQPAATVISSGDAEGYAHPRPEIVGASAVTGRVEVDLDNDRLQTPLIYMTEIERSVTLGALDRLDVDGLPGLPAGTQVVVPGRFLDELNDRALLSPDQERQIAQAPADEQSDLRNALRAETRTHFRAVEDAKEAGGFHASVSMTVANGPVSAEYKRRSLWRSRVLDRNHYGLVNVRTDGEIIMCATLNETEEDWIIHAFTARAGEADPPSP